MKFVSAPEGDEARARLIDKAEKDDISYLEVMRSASLR